MTEEVIQVGRFVYIIFGIAGILAGIFTIALEFNNKRNLCLGILVLIGGIISVILFATTFGKLVW